MKTKGERTSGRIPIDLKAKLDEATSQHGVKESDILRAALIGFFKSYDAGQSIEVELGRFIRKPGSPPGVIPDTAGSYASNLTGVLSAAQNLKAKKGLGGKLAPSKHIPPPNAP